MRLIVSTSTRSLKYASDAVGENQPDIQPDQRTAASKDKPHEATDRAVLLDAIAIVDPDEREVLAHRERLRRARSRRGMLSDAVIAKPPKRDARDEQRELHRIGTLSHHPHPSEICQEQNRNRDSDEEDDLLRAVQEPGRNVGCSTGVVRFRAYRSFAWKTEAPPPQTRSAHSSEIEPTRERSERAHFRIVDATEPVGLHHPVPDAPEENDQNDPFQLPPGKRVRRPRVKKSVQKRSASEIASKKRGVSIRRRIIPGRWCPHGAKRGDENVNVLRAQNASEPERTSARAKAASQRRESDRANYLESTNSFSAPPLGPPALVCGREKALTSCIGQDRFFQSREKINAPLPHVSRGGLDAWSAQLLLDWLRQHVHVHGPTRAKKSHALE